MRGKKTEAMDAFPHWIIILIVVIVLARMAVFLARRFGLPSTSVLILFGILLGPSALNLLEAPMVLGTWGSPSSGPLHGVFKILAEIGLIQLMFLAGLKVDWRELKKILKLSLSVGAWGFLLTAVSVAVLTRVFVDRWAEVLALSSVVSASSFGISIYYFSEMKGLNSQVAAMVSGAAIFGGLLAILLMIGSQATNYAMIYGPSKMGIAVSWFLAKLIMFFAIAYFLTSRFLRLASRSGFFKRPRQMLIGYLLLVASLYAWAAMHFGSFAAVGVASLGGALLGASTLEVKEKIAKGFDSFLASIPVGILLVAIGIGVNVNAVQNSILLLVVLLIVVIGAKLIGAWIATRKGLHPLGERAPIMIGNLPQGEMGVLIAAYLFSRGLVNPLQFTAAIIVVVALTMITPLLLKIASTELSRKQLTMTVPLQTRD